MATFRNVKYTELVREMNSPEIHWEANNVRVIRHFTTSWSDKDLFVSKVLGYPTLTNAGSATAYISRLTPMSYPVPGGVATFVHAVSADVRGIGVPDADTADANLNFPNRTMIDANSVALYKKARISVEYQSLTYEVQEDDVVGYTEATLARYVTVRYKPQIESFTFGKGNWYYKTGDQAARVSFGIPKLEGKILLDLTWHQVPRITHLDGTTSEYPEAITTHLGCVNNAEFFGYPAGTLLLSAAEIMPIRSPIGRRLHDIRYIMTYFEPTPGAGHNYILRFFSPNGNAAPADPVYTEVTSSGTEAGKRIYPPKDFSQLFTPI